MVESWVKAVGERTKIPSFEEVLRDPKQNGYFTAMVRAALRGDGGLGTWAHIETSRSDSNTVDRSILESALAKIQVRTIAGEPVGKKAPTLRAGEPLTQEERTALQPFYTAFQRASASVETLDKQFNKEELHAIINWAGNNSPELSALLARTGNNTGIFAEALRSIAFSNPPLFATLAGQLENARRIARADSGLIAKLHDLGAKHGIPMPDLLDAVNNAYSTGEARRNIQELIQNQMRGAWFAPLRARFSALSVDAFGSLSRYKARDRNRREVLSEGSGDVTTASESLASALLRTIQADPSSPDLSRESGTFAETFERMLAGPKTPTDHESTKQRLILAQQSVSKGIVNDASVTALLTSKYRVAGHARRIDDALWNDRTDDDNAEEIARIILDSEYEDAFSSHGGSGEPGFFTRLWGWLFDSKSTRGSLYTENDVKSLRDKIKTNTTR